MAVDAREPVRSYQIPHVDNTTAEDIARMILAITAIGVDMGGVLTSLTGKAASSHTHAMSDIIGLAAALAAKMDASASFALNDLSDVNTAGATSQMVLTWNGSTWVPSAVDIDNVVDMTAVGLTLAKAASKPAARLAAGVSGLTLVGDLAYTILAADRFVATSAAFSVQRIWTLPAASGAVGGDPVFLFDQAGGWTSGHKLRIGVTGADTINGGTTFDVTTPYSLVMCIPDGSGKWTVSAIGSTGALQASSSLSDVASKSAARVNLAIDTRVAVANTSPSFAADKFDYVWESLSASRTGMLLAASAYNDGQAIWLSDGSGNCDPSKTITAIVNTSPGSDTIIGDAVISSPFGRLMLICDGAGKFYGTEFVSWGVGPGQGLRADSTGKLPAIDISQGTGIVVPTFSWQTFTASGTLNLTGLNANALLEVEGWGGGGGGYNVITGGGGGGGARKRAVLRVGDLTTTVAVTIGAGGASGAPATAGGNTTLGAYFTAYGGGAGGASSGGGGGGEDGAGGNGSGSTNGVGGVDGGGISASAATLPSGGAGGGGGNTLNPNTIVHAYNGGGAGGSGGSGTGKMNGTGSVNGGGGGGSGQGTPAALGGLSRNGGAGGDRSVAGTAPGGGGGTLAAGARGELRVRIIGG